MLYFLAFFLPPNLSPLHLWQPGLSSAAGGASVCAEQDGDGKIDIHTEVWT